MYQIYEVSLPYFAYKTRSKVETQLTDLTWYPGTAVCFLHQEILVVQDNHVNNTNTRSHTMTISEIMKMTPGANESLKACGLRNNVLNHLTMQKDYKKCLDHFHVSKYFLGAYICYMFEPNRKFLQQYSIEKVANALLNPMYVYHLFISEPLDLLQTVHVYAFTESVVNSRYFPYASSMYGDEVIRGNQSNWLQYRNYIINQRLLRRPYDTMCIDVEEINYYKCLTELVTQRASRFPYTVATNDEHLDVVPFSQLDMMNVDNSSKNVLEIHRESESDSEHECLGKQQCETSIAFTDVKELVAGPVPDKLWITASVPSSPPITVTYYPSISFTEYVNYICGCIGIWFGVSFMSLKSFASHLPRQIAIVNCCNHFHMKCFLSFLFYSGCLAGFIIQATERIQVFFAYGTDTTVELNRSNETSYPSILPCFRYVDILDRRDHVKLNISPPGNSNSGSHNYHDLAQLTVKQIFDLTPRPDDFLSGCRFRDQSVSQMTNMMKDKCVKIFRVDKAVSGANVCFIVKPQEERIYDPDRVASSLTHSLFVYQLKLNVTFNVVDIITLTYFTSHKRIPYLSRNYASRFALGSGIPGSSKHNVVFAYSISHHFKYLTPPFDTLCDDRESSHTCFQDCIHSKLVTTIGRLPYTEVITEPIDLKILHYEDMKNNKTILTAVNAADVSCRMSCSRPPCSVDVSFTSTQSHALYTENSLLLIAFVPSSPNLHVTSVPLTGFIDLVLYLSNCFGIWFGFSIMSFHPSKWTCFWRRKSTKVK